MEHKICLDTDFLVNLLRNKEEEVQFVEEKEDNAIFATTYISLFELYYGAFKSNKQENNLKAIEEISWRVHLLNLSEKSAREAGRTLSILERKGELIDFRDLLIGTIAKTNDFCIKTSNIKHFNKIEGLKIV